MSVLREAPDVPFIRPGDLGRLCPGIRCDGIHFTSDFPEFGCRGSPALLDDFFARFLLKLSCGEKKERRRPGGLCDQTKRGYVRLQGAIIHGRHWLCREHGRSRGPMGPCFCERQRNDLLKPKKGEGSLGPCFCERPRNETKKLANRRGEVFGRPLILDPAAVPA